MHVEEQPIICVSRCLGFENCRFNGGIVTDSTVDKLKGFVKFITVCPECDIGLPTPRNALRVVEINGKLHILDPKNNSDYTDELDLFTNNFIQNLHPIDGFIFKGRSPSCGIKDVKVYSSPNSKASYAKSTGLFTQHILDKYELFPIEDEGRLMNFKIRETFFTKIFALSEYRKVIEINTLDALVDYHKKNNMLFNSFSAKGTKELEHIITANYRQFPDNLFDNYELMLRSVLSRSPRYTSNIKVLLRALEYFNKFISAPEKQFILDSINKYRLCQIPLSVPLNIIKAYIIRFDINQLKDQSFFEPYPSELVEMRDSGKGV